MGGRARHVRRRDARSRAAGRRGAGAGRRPAAGTGAPAGLADGGDHAGGRGGDAGGAGDGTAKSATGTRAAAQTDTEDTIATSGVVLARRAGAFFLRKSFDDPLYKAVFQAYVSHLIKHGFPQEFFIEGGRSRTGKSLAPRLGMLSWNVDAFLASARRDMFFVPIAISYERLVEESSILGELSGDEKTKESMLNLVKARKYLQRRFGSAHVSFGNAISLADVLADRREAFRAAAPDADALTPGANDRATARFLLGFGFPR